MLVAAIYATYEMGKQQPNIYLVCVAVIIFMGGMMWLSSKTPSKNQDENDQ